MSRTTALKEAQRRYEKTNKRIQSKKRYRKTAPENVREKIKRHDRIKFKTKYYLSTRFKVCINKINLSFIEPIMREKYPDFEFPNNRSKWLALAEFFGII